MKRPGDAISQAKTITVKLSNYNIELACPPGLPSWEVISPATQLLGESVTGKSGDNILLFGCYQGALLAYLAMKVAGVHLSVIENNLSALNATLGTLEKNNIPKSVVNFIHEIDLRPNDQQVYDTVIVQPSKGRLLTRRWLVQAYAALKPGGRLYLAGSNASGIQSMIKDAEALFGSGRILGYKKGNRVSFFTRSLQEQEKPAWTGTPGITPNTRVEFSIEIKGMNFRIISLPGVFSYDHLDEGTQMLLEAIEIPIGSTVLDMGCGYGIIGLFAAFNGASLVHLADNNLLAIAAAQDTLLINHVNNAEVFPWDFFDHPVLHEYDLVLSNPPFHTGHAVDYQAAQVMIRQSFNSLKPQGNLVIVANRFIRYDRLINNIFGNVRVVAESGKFHVLSGLKSSHAYHKVKGG